ncbi:MAG: hypothetical protein DI535_08995 [Citrobacter freundii]|nr:MAG: hypothetical protein DI535_08995 [Citrobacter freundii]
MKKTCDELCEASGVREASRFWGKQMFQRFWRFQKFQGFQEFQTFQKFQKYQGGRSSRGVS